MPVALASRNSRHLCRKPSTSASDSASIVSLIGTSVLSSRTIVPRALRRRAIDSLDDVVGRRDTLLGVPQKYAVANGGNDE
jgi:hypothetical protein